MSLPVVKTPEYELVMPSTGERYKYRPFVVGEEKLLLMAIESQDQKQMVDVLRQIIKSCLFDRVDTNKLPMFDLEYIFLQLRCKSVGEVIKMKVKSDVEGKILDVDVDLTKAEVIKDPSHKTTFQLNSEIGVVMRYPVFEDIEKYTKIDNEIELGMSIIRDCLVQVFTAEEVTDVTKESPEAVEQFINSLSRDHFNKIVNFFETMPRLRQVIKYKDTHANTDKEIVLEGLSNFFI